MNFNQIGPKTIRSLIIIDDYLEKYLHASLVCDTIFTSSFCNLEANIIFSDNNISNMINRKTLKRKNIENKIIN